MRELFWEYLQWANARLIEEFGVDFDIASMLEEDMAKLEIYSPPYGRLLLAIDGSEVAGLACMKRIREDIGEIKRMYVRPSFRGRGLGRALLEGLIREARVIGYPRIRLDSTRFMKEAHSLYRSAGFEEIDEYPESEIPEEFRAHWIFMEKRLEGNTSIPTTSESPVGKPTRQRIAIALVFCLWLAYTVLQTLVVMQRLSEPAYAAIGFLPGMLGVGALLGAGISREECYLRIAPLSWKGFGVLAGVFVFALAAILPSGVWRGWDWIAALVYAPANGISQELFFRSALMPATLATFKKRTTLALILHSILFGLWHIGPLFLETPAPIVAAIMLVPFLSGIGWGWQVKRDGTVVWAMIQHSLIWVIASPFAFGP